MEKYYVSGCKGQDDDIVTCDDSEAEFWTLYQRMADGTSQGIIDLKFREDAEAAMTVYVECDVLQRKVEDSEALMLAMRDDSRESRSKLELITAECAALINYIDGECYTESKRTGVYTCAGINKPASPATDAMVNEIRAEGVELAINHLMNKFEGTGHIGVPVMALESLANQLRADAAKDGSDD